MALLSTEIERINQMYRIKSSDLEELKLFFLSYNFLKIKVFVDGNTDVLIWQIKGIRK